MDTVNPYQLGVREWADVMTPILETFGNIGRLDDPTAWQRWGADILSLSSLSGVILPDPYEYADWREWAVRFVQILDTRAT